MAPASSTLSCPDPFARAPRADGLARGRLVPIPPSLHGILAALVVRDTRGAALDAAQRLTHFPASPLVTLSWNAGSEVGLVDTSPARRGWRPFGAQIVIGGSRSRPMVSWAPQDGRGYIACFTPDVARSLFGVDPAAAQERVVPARALLSETWMTGLDALFAAEDDSATMNGLESLLAPRWRALHGPLSGAASLRRLGRHWVDRLAWQAHDWRRTCSPRQVERRVKAYSGRSLREWQALTRTEGLFFAARERQANGQDFEWATLALDEGFADQAHMSRAARQITGFAPTAFADRFNKDESFWMYRLWV